jgi:hypothetical protein
VRFKRWTHHILVLGGFLSLLGPPGQVSAASSVDASLTVRPFAGIPPASVNDLTANPGTVDGQARLHWTAPTVLPGSTLDAYQIRVQTFSLSSVGGSTTTWWNSGGGWLIQGLYGESPGSSVTRTLGPPGSGSNHTASFIPGATYYFAVRSADDMGTPRDFWSDVVQVVSGQTFRLVTGIAPLRPNGLSMSLSAGQFTVAWRPVRYGVDGQPMTIDRYVVYRYDAIGSGPTHSVDVPADTTSFTDTVGGLTYYYRIVAVSVGGAVSAASDYVDSSNQTNRYVIAPSDLETRVVIPGALAIELNTERTGLNDDLEIVALHQPQNENSTTLKSYLFRVLHAQTGQEAPRFAFSQPLAEVQVSYALNLPTLGLTSQIRSSLDNASAEAQAIAQLISLYWFNGSHFIRLGGTVLVQSQALMITSRNLGLYEVRAVSMPTRFGLTRNSPYPRMITPNGAENRRVFWFFDNPADETVEGTIYDIRGARVRGLSVNGMSPTVNSIVWDGRDDQGAVVPSGVYLYEIKAGNDKETGTVVVAR